MNLLSRRLVRKERGDLRGQNSNPEVEFRTTQTNEGDPRTVSVFCMKSEEDSVPEMRAFHTSLFSELSTDRANYPVRHVL